MNDRTESTSSEALPIAGSRVTYHGSMTEHHGKSFLLFPHGSYLDEDDSDCECEYEAEPRHTLIDVNHTSSDAMNHVRATSFTVAPGRWWPEDAIDIRRGGFVYKASHATEGGSPNARVLSFYTANGLLMRTWCVFGELTDNVRLLDDRGRDPLAATRMVFALPSQPTS
jgi:hypothetical protein